MRIRYFIARVLACFTQVVPNVPSVTSVPYSASFPPAFSVPACSIASSKSRFILSSAKERCFERSLRLAIFACLCAFMRLYAPLLPCRLRVAVSLCRICVARLYILHMQRYNTRGKRVGYLRILTLRPSRTSLSSQKSAIAFGSAMCSSLRILPARVSSSSSSRTGTTCWRMIAPPSISSSTK